jgi:hypothetical protein
LQSTANQIAGSATAVGGNLQTPDQQNAQNCLNRRSSLHIADSATARFLHFSRLRAPILRMSEKLPEGFLKRQLDIRVDSATADLLYGVGDTVADCIPAAHFSSIAVNCIFQVVIELPHA